MRNNQQTILKNLDINQILLYHSCEHPCLMLDYITEVLPGKYCKAYKNFTYNEWFFSGHFRNDPNVPCSIQIEAMSQAFLMTFLTLDGNHKKETACLNINNVQFKQKIIPGQRLDLTAELEEFRRGIAVGTVCGTVCGSPACSAEFVIGIPEILSQYVPRTDKLPEKN